MIMGGSLAWPPLLGKQPKFGITELANALDYCARGVLPTKERPTACLAGRAHSVVRPHTAHTACNENTSHAARASCGATSTSRCLRVAVRTAKPYKPPRCRRHTLLARRRRVFGRVHMRAPRHLPQRRRERSGAQTRFGLCAPLVSATGAPAYSGADRSPVSAEAACRMLSEPKGCFPERAHSPA